ncbi:MAG: hypothetical protein GY847_03060 [Proteobacteria bacterium]|nr:hypothetical protein [Pseudomonadota bacterium]
MSCNEVKKYLDAYMDGELETGIMLEVDNHLEACEGCRAVIVVKRKLKNELLNLGRIRAPEQLQKNILNSTQRRRRTRMVAVIAAGPLAAAAALVLMFALPENDPVKEPLAAVVEDVVERHVRELPMEVQGPDPVQAASWFRGKVDFPVRAPALDLKRASFEGARLSNVRAHQAAHMTYNLDGHRVTLMIFNPHTALLRGGQHIKVGRRDVLLGRRNGFNVAVFFDGDMAYALSSDLSQDRLLKLVADFER